MSKRVILILYLVFSVITVAIFAALIQAVSGHDEPFKVDFYFISIYNPIVLLAFIMINISLGVANLIFLNTGHNQVATFKMTEEEATEKRSEEINEEINNKYQERINEIKTNFLTKSHGATDLKQKIEKALWSLCKDLELSQGLVYVANNFKEPFNFTLHSTYAYVGDLDQIKNIEYGVGVSGQVAKTGDFIYLKEIPKGYLKIVSGLGETSPDYLLVIPIKVNETVVGIIELAGLGGLNHEEVNTILELVQGPFSTLIQK